MPSHPGKSKLDSIAFSVLDSITPKAKGVTRANDNPIVVSKVLVLFLEKFRDASLSDNGNFELILVKPEFAKLGISGDIDSVIDISAAFLTGKIMKSKLDRILRRTPPKANIGSRPYTIPGISVAIEYWYVMYIEIKNPAIIPPIAPTTPMNNPYQV